MNQNDNEQKDRAKPHGAIPIVVTVLSLIALGVSWYLSNSSDSPSTRVAFLVSQAVVISIVIWQACDPFADAAQWIGNSFHLPGSVRGATLDAIASSMPELFTGIFFVLVAFMSADDSLESIREKAADGYGSAIATCAGSAIYNMILIPAFCALVISLRRPQRPTIDIEPEVVQRDGLWFIGCEALLIVFLFQDEMIWWMGVVFLVLYACYVASLYWHAATHRQAVKAIHKHLEDVSEEHHTERIVGALRDQGVRASHQMVDKIRAAAANDEDENEESAGVLFGFVKIRLGHVSSWIVILISTVVAAVACFWLVEVTNETARTLNVPVFFVAVIIAAAASSVPDTFLSIAAALRGDDSGAVSNAFGSNIFDICICLSIPLLVNSALVGWSGVPLTQDGQPIAGLVDLRILLIVLSAVTLTILWHRRQLTRGKAIILTCLYGVFIAYAVFGSLGFSFIAWLYKLIGV